MRMRSTVSVGLLFLAIASLGLAASNAEMYFTSDKNGQNRVTNVQEGNSVWIVIHDPDENIDCDVRDKIWTDVKIMDPKTGAYIVWVSYLTAAGDEDGDGYDEEEYEPYFGHFPGNPGWLGADYLEETGADTGLFVSSRAFQIGTRENYDVEQQNTHVVDDSLGYLGIARLPFDFQWGSVEYIDPDFDLPAATNLWSDECGIFGPRPALLADDWPFREVDAFDDALDAFLPSEEAGLDDGYLVGRFENMDTLIGMVVDQNDPTDVATAMMKIIDTEGTITFDQEIYKDANGSATITVVDADENLNCNEVEYVPVFILINPGSWNAVQTAGPNSFCSLLATGGVIPNDAAAASILDRPIRWYNIYNSGLNVGVHFSWSTPDAHPNNDVNNNQEIVNGTYFVQYPTAGSVATFDTVDETGYCRVMFYAQETGVNTGVFQLNLNSILVDLGFDSLRVRDVLAAYYIDPNDFDDFKLDTAYIEEKMHSITSFTDATRQDKEVYWLGRAPVYVQVIDANANVDPCCPEQVVVFVCDPHNEDDAEWLILDETSSNSPVFFTNAGTELAPVWDALGVGIADGDGGYQLQLDNWKLEAFNEDDVYARYNDVYYVAEDLADLGDASIHTAFPPEIDRTRVANDVSFDLMSIGDTQVYNGSTVNMYFLDRQGNRVNGYVNSDCVFIEVVDPDQDEDQLRRERIDGYWDGGQNAPFGPVDANDWDCGPVGDLLHPRNALLGDLNIFNDSPAGSIGALAWDPATEKMVLEGDGGWPKIYVLNPRSGHWAALDLLETGIATGDFVSVICVDLVSAYECVPTLGALPGDTILAFYQDPSNHSDSAMIQVKVGIGGGGTPPSQASTTAFVNATGAAVQNYTDADLVYVRVVDPSHAGAAVLRGAVTILGVVYDLWPISGAGCRDDMPPLPPPTGDDVFVTVGLDLGLAAGASITAMYVDPADPSDTSSDTIPIIASKLDISSFYAGPSPATGSVTFGYKGAGMASLMSVEVYDLAGHLVWANELANVTKIVWSCGSLANGAYIYLVTATDGTDTFNDKGTLFINR